ncbi:hypothetical protein OVA14_03900 [Agrococcus sp. SL85]|uniref:hypothetical protein n=1 Tax=Agrococcus sp. SL85 TaxID=2995141 RepID=UPI00226D0B4E|nr:hypothetical protein [Agrococcus sp. SL85]WAC66922.1 hypothetical protein OVA14_03900 [Agrococcus sp. SL85]
MPDRILLGSAPRPTDGTVLAKRIRKLMIAAEPARIACTAHIDAVLDGPDIERLDLDLTGYVLGSEHDRDRSRIEPQGAPITSEEGVLRHLRVHAAPMRVSGADVTLDLELQGVPVRWIETDAGELALELGRPSDDRPVHGSMRVAVPKEQLGDAVRGLAEPMLQELGVAVSRLDLELEALTPRSVRAYADAKVRKGLLGASAHGAATATLDDRLGLTLDDISLDSGNPLVGAMLAVARGRIQGFEGHRIDLAAELPAGVRVEDVQVRVERDVVVEARLA